MTQAAATARTPHRLAEITFDSQSLGTRSVELEIEKHKAVSDMLADSHFRPHGIKDATGPYRLHMALADARLVMHIRCNQSGQETDLTLPLSALQQHLSDYTILCDNFYKTAREGNFHRLEAIDAGRRSIHDEAAAFLAEALESAIEIDKITARRLFSLLYVLHMRNTPLSL